VFGALVHHADAALRIGDQEWGIHGVEDARHGTKWKRAG
jgi:hypothetical protein